MAVRVSLDRSWGRTPKPEPSSDPNPCQSDQTRQPRLTRAVAGLVPCWPARTSVGRPLHLPAVGPCRSVPSPTSGRQFRSSLGLAAQASTILTPQSPSVGSGVPAPSDPGHGRPFTGLGISCRMPGWNRCNVQISNGNPLGKNYYAKGISKRRNSRGRFNNNQSV